MAKSTRRKGNILKGGRPPLLAGTSIEDRASANINARRKSAKATRKLINTHHQLHKARAAAVISNDQALIEELDTEIQQLGGLEAYQAASLTGQDKDRGGDSSEKLVEWLHKRGLVSQKKATGIDGLRVLEIGALSSRNAISRKVGQGVESVTRIDLHSQEPSTIEQIDFMDFPVPAADKDKFDVVSLSLVLNYVPDASQRGDMLERTTKFLRSLGPVHEGSKLQSRSTLSPCLFVVLPLPCLSNSRYMTFEHFITIMQNLDYQVIEHHQSQKLMYMLFRWSAEASLRSRTNISFRKQELKPGRSRNNFAITLHTS